MTNFISIIFISLGCLLFYQVCKIIFVSKKEKNQSSTTPNFKIEVATNKYINDYVERMPKQSKGNSRVLQGGGKIHFAESVAEGSILVREETISVLTAIGDRFS